MGASKAATPKRMSHVRTVVQTGNRTLTSSQSSTISMQLMLARKPTFIARLTHTLIIFGPNS